MRIAFYAPLKPPDHPVASGDRTMARLLIAALRRAGHEVEIAATLGSRDGDGDAACQARVRDIGQRLAARFLRGCARHKERRPDLWFTYHLYYKAPDWLGPPVAEALAIPYVVAEASVAGKRSAGPWALGHAATLAALGRADAVIGPNQADREGVLPALAGSQIWHDLPPFLDAGPFAAVAADRARRRETLAASHGIDTAVPWLITTAMMREGDKLASYRLLAAALSRNLALPWHLLVIGDGPARDAVEAEFAPCAGRVTWLGRIEGPALAATLAAGDLMVWPAINEAYGMALLEGQAAGLPVLAGASGGVAGIVADGVSGKLVPPGDVAAFAAALAALLAQPAVLRALGAAASARIGALHDISAASRRLDTILRGVVGARKR
jgi:glycosyltransferase involved in cell wall biosynthesis